MPAHKITFPDDVVKKAYNESVSARQLAAILGVSHSVTAVRIAQEAGLTIPAPHWLRSRDELPGAPPAAETVSSDAALERAKSECAHVKRLYAEALGQINTQEEMVAGIAERFSEPRLRPVFSARKPKNASMPARTAVLLLSDWQLGELVNEVETGGTNAYSWAIAERRCQRLVDAVVGSLENQMRAYRIERLVIALLGDMVEGHDVFSGQAWSLERDAAMQAVDGADLLASTITAIVEPFLPSLLVDIYAVPGNHGRPGGRKAGALPVTFSFDVLLYEMLRRQLSSWPIREFGMEPAGRLLFMAADQVCLMTHGNEVRGWGGFPYYGLDKTHAKLTMEMETLFTFWLLGHWHSAATLPAGRGMRVVNGTLVGANQLTQAAVLTTSAPSQTLLYMSKDLGLAETAYMVLETGQKKSPHIYGGS